jgi:excisionase family DNA binding protein
MKNHLKQIKQCFTLSSSIVPSFAGMEITSKEFLTVHEARAFLGVSRSFLYRLKDTKLQAYALGKKTYFKKSDLENLFTKKSPHNS